MLNWKDKKIFFLLLVAVIIVSIIAYSERGITAMEKRKRAENIAYSMDKNAMLVDVYASGYRANGRFSSWTYSYYSPMNDNLILITISNTGKVNVRTQGLYLDINISALSPTVNWTIDSDKAYKIALSNPDVRRFLEHWPDVETFFFLYSRYGSTNNSAWSIKFHSWGVLDDPNSVLIIINARTGEILYVESYLRESSSYSICFVPIVIIISILLVISLSMSKRFPNFFTATGFALFLIPTLYLRIYYSTSIFTFMTLVFAAVLWLGTKRRMSSTDLNMEHQQVYGLFGLLAADYFGLLIARFLLIPYSYPNLLWSSLLIINGAILYIILSLTSEEEGTGKILKFFNK